MSGTIDPKLIDVTLPDETGYPSDIAAEDKRDVMMAMVQEAGATVTAFPDSWYIDPNDWDDAARDNDKYNTWPDSYLDRFTNQGSGNGGYSTHECTTHSLVKLAESARNRARAIAVGPPVPLKRLEASATSASVWFSCLSIYAEANSREWGGAGVRQVLSIAARRGFLPDKIQPKDYGFAHTLQGTCGAGGVNQSRGPWVPLSKFPSGWQETSKHFRPLEYIFPETWEQSVCLVLRGIGVGVGRDGHAVPHMRWMPQEKLMRYPDSYDIYRYDSINRIKATVGGSFGIVSFITPDDWNKPAG